MQDGLLNGTYPIGRFHRFVIRDPKKRTIHAATFPERVLHHALMSVCEPVFERLTIFDSYACRTGKGQWAAVRRAEQFATRKPFFLKMDIRKYFDSISHECLQTALERRFKDPGVLAWFRKIIGSYHTLPGKGLPIGSLTSQHLANFYLGILDRFVKEKLRRKEYLRYMDDFAIWGEDARELKTIERAVVAFLDGELGLVPKPTPWINRSIHGMDFLGCRIFPGYSTLNRRSRVRFRRKLKLYRRWCEGGLMDEAGLQVHLQALVGFVTQTKSWHFRQRVLKNLGQGSIGLEPGETGWQLEQQRAELPFSQPQQEQPLEHEQQPRLPSRQSSDQGRTAPTWN